MVIVAIGQCVQALTALGFTGLEAEVYTFLVQESPATGYRVAQVLTKPAANVYKSLEALERKGAILVDEGASRVYRAVPAEELLSRLERSFDERRERAAQALAQLQEGAADDDRVYGLQGREQVLERCRAMLARCRRNAVLDIFPLPLQWLRPDLEGAAARGVEVVAKVFEPTEVEGAKIVLNHRSEAVMGLYPGQLIILIIDGAELLVAVLGPDGTDVHQAVWTGSAYLSWAFYCAFVSEILFHAFLARIEQGASSDELRTVLSSFRHLFATDDVPGYGAFVARFERPRPDRNE